MIGARKVDHGRRGIYDYLMPFDIGNDFSLLISFLVWLLPKAVVTSSTQSYQFPVVHILMIENEYINDIVVGTSLLNLYAKCGGVDKAFKVFAEVPHKNLVSGDSMIGAYASNGLTAEALSLFHQMQVEGFCQDKTTFISVINALNDMTVMNDGRRLHAILSSHVDVVFQTAIVNAYGKCGSLSDAITLFHKMAHRDVVTWCAIIIACIQNDHDKDAIKFFYQMHHNATDVDEAIFACMLDVCGRLSLLDKGQELHSTIIENGCENGINVGTALINMYGKCGSSSDSKFVFTKLQNRNMVTWSSMIGSYVHNGQGKEAIELFQPMQNEQVMHNEVTFHSILTACSHTWKIGDGVNYLALLSQVEGLPQREEYILSMVDLPGRAGWFGKAKSFVLDYTQTLLAFLGSCQKRANVGLGRSVIENPLEPDKRC